MIGMGEKKELPGLMEEILGIASSPQTPPEERDMMLRDSFFSHSPQNMGALVRWVISFESTNMDTYGAAMENLRAYLGEGKELEPADLEAVRSVALDDGAPGRVRARMMLEMVAEAREKKELRVLSEFMFSPDAAEDMKMAIAGDVSYFLQNTARVDVLARFMLDTDACSEGIFGAALGTYRELSAHGAAMTDGQVSMVGKNLSEGKNTGRAHELLGIMARASLRTVLENRDIPETEKVRVLGDAERFRSDPRAFGSLVGFMLDSGVLLASRALTEAARECFVSALRKGLKPREDHMVKIVGTLTAGPGKRALQQAQRENALWMLHQMILQGLQVPRDKCQGRIMNAAVEILPAEGTPGYGQQRERKVYGLKGVKLLLGDWYERLRAGMKAERCWHFRPEDLEKLKADTKHPDDEVRMEAMMVEEVLGRLLPLLEKGTGERGERIAEAIERYLGNARPNPATEKILESYLRTKEVARISAPPREMPNVEEITPLVLDVEDAERGRAIARRLIEKIKARRGVDKLPGEERAEKERAKGERRGGGA